MIDICIFVDRSRALFTCGDEPKILNKVNVQLWGEDGLAGVKSFYKQTEDQMQRWEQLQDKLAQMRS